MDWTVVLTMALTLHLVLLGWLHVRMNAGFDRLEKRIDVLYEHSEQTYVRKDVLRASGARLKIVE